MKSIKTNEYTFFLVSVLIILVFPLASSSKADEVDPPDIYRSVELLRRELALVRENIQKPADTRANIPIESAQLHEVYFQALTLLHKSSRLCFETSQSVVAPPVDSELPIPKILESNDIHEKVEAARNQVRCAKTGLSITDHVEDLERDSTKTTTDVFKSIVQANRQLNLMLERPFVSGDVYAITQQANDYLTSILDKLAPVWKTKNKLLPESEESKVSIDVYNLMLENFHIIEQIAKTSEIKTLHLGSEIQEPIVPSDVYNLSSIVLSELHNFASLIGIDQTYSLGLVTEKTSSDVFRQALVLENRLHILQGIANEFPHWAEMNN